MDCTMFIVAALVLVTAAQAELSYDYYEKTCPQVENIVKQVLLSYHYSDQRIGASVLRMHFHDCFVDGCDGSILIDSTPGNTAEKDFPANNPSIRGYYVIDAAKSRLEKVCPGVVSCADILAYAARDGTHLLGGPHWNIRAGRKDGRVSQAARALQFLPPPFANITQLIGGFSVKNLNKKDLVFLSGGHSVGFSLCSSFNNRLYNFTGKGDQDPSLDATLAAKLKTQCPPPGASSDPIIPMDGTPFNVDTNYLKGILKQRGLLTSDQALLDDPETAAEVHKSAYSPEYFLSGFISSMIKMSEIEVKTQGEVRKHCNVIN